MSDGWGGDVVRGSIYDFPKYYDVLFGSDWRAEFHFLRACFERFAALPRGRAVRSVFEPACGTGRLLIRFAKAGYSVGGIDLNEAAVAYCNARLQRHGFPASVRVGDMTRFRSPRQWDAAFNPINSFRHLLGEEAAAGHLRCMADCVRPGGLYVIGLHLIPTQGERIQDEAWSARRGQLVVNSYMWSKGIDPHRRIERLGMTVDVYRPTGRMRIEDEMEYFTYTAEQFRTLLARVPQWEPVATYDFAYDIDTPVRVDERTEDVVFVLRRRGE
ncbi:MAG: class I SAM-dependent methyltransferase [Planctomycetota bacterium]|nr:MAG: class I SAM-dependent methyltransferase [Planctomycetota bacterium]